MSWGGGGGVTPSQKTEAGGGGGISSSGNIREDEISNPGDWSMEEGGILTSRRT